MVDGTLSLVLPAYNEEANLEIVVKEALEELPKNFSSFEIIIVDDGSKDRTPGLADRLAAGQPGLVKVIHHRPNRGYGAALTSGFEAARGDYLMFMDSDRQFRAADVRLLAPYVGKADIVAGYRKKRHDSFYRFLIGYTFNTIVTLFFGIHLRDIDCGFKIFRAEMLKTMQLTSPGALINTEIHAKAQRQGRSLIEVGVNNYPRLAGDQSGASLRVIGRAGRETVALWWRMRFYAVPEGLTGDDTEKDAALARRVNRASKPFPSFNTFGVLGVLVVFGVVWRWTRRG